MSELQRHPRRRPLRNAVLPPLSTVLNDVELPQRRTFGPNARSRSLKKGETFHAPSSTPSDDSHPILNVPTLPRRSPTCPQSLKEVIFASQNRMSGLLGSVERTLSGLGKDSTASSHLDNDFPVPRGVLNANIPHTDPMDIDEDPRKSKTTTNDNRHIAVSDSGVGSSIGDSNHGEAKGDEHLRQNPLQTTVTKAQGTLKTAITRSICLDTIQSSSAPSLSSGATKQIDRCILTPILRENKFKSFHPVVRGVPERISKNAITCLRDLEKTLLYLAPHHSHSKNSYLSFCEFTIQCLHTTVGHLTDRDQRLPADIPYTNGYFLDLVEQIRQYAGMINVARARRASSRDSTSNQLDYSSGEELVLKGGLGQTGRPAELVRQKKGKTISLRTGEAYKEPKPVIPTLKRALSTEAVDASVKRSMARRKKNEPPMNINKKCPDCDRVFRRPCDYTKHEKTHSRPWKCPQSGCKYFEFGWPTEKERDRHVNDKHSAYPAFYRCAFTPCTYQSKRESNCKQHMEKTHDYDYIRTKNNARDGRRASARPSPKRVKIATPKTGQMSAFTPTSAATPSPYTSPYQQQVNDAHNVTPSPYASPYQQPVNHVPDATPSPYASPYQQPVTHVPNETAVYGGNVDLSNNNMFAHDFELFGGSAESRFDGFNAFQPTDFSTFHAALQATDRNQYIPPAEIANPPAPPSHMNGIAGQAAHIPDHLASNDGTPITNPSPINANFMNPSPMFNGNSHLDVSFEWDSGNSEYSAVNLQLMGSSVHSSAVQSPGSPYQAPSSATSPDLDYQNAYLSPGGQGNPMLYSPSAQSLDEGFYDTHNEADKLMDDSHFNDQNIEQDHPVQDNADPNAVISAPSEDLGLGNSNPMFSLDQFQDVSWPSLPSVGAIDATMDIDDFLISDQI